jgi:ubiquinone/menaquinone biosynthesis C-methylase UbiE
MTGDAVQAQYEAYPYPERDPKDEAKRLVEGSPSHLDEVDHYCFAGRLRHRSPFRVLVAGGGTGDALVMLAQHAKDRGIAAEITYLDLSAASRRIAEARVAARGLDNVRFVSGSLLEVASLAPGAYDYIDCCGVLHHLADPPAGLAALERVLAPGGAMGLMVYGWLGRTGVYSLQAALAALAPDSDLSVRLSAARRLVRDLPATNWAKRNPLLGELATDTDAGLYDLLLHSRDRAYSVPELVEFLATSGLAPITFIEPARYDPRSWINDAALARRAAQLAPLDAAALAENLAGTMKTHILYAARRNELDGRIAVASGEATIPVPRSGAKALVPMLARGGVLKLDLDGHPLRRDIPPGLAPLLDAIDGSRTLGEIGKRLGWDAATLTQRFERLYALLNPINLLTLRF